MVYFPKNILDLIFSFDPTYHTIFKTVLEFFDCFKINEKNCLIMEHFSYENPSNNDIISWLHYNHYLYNKKVKNRYDDFLKQYNISIE